VRGPRAWCSGSKHFDSSGNWGHHRVIRLMSAVRFLSVREILERCYRGVTEVLRRCYRGVTELLERC
jgi:hypothetical protein